MSLEGYQAKHSDIYEEFRGDIEEAKLAMTRLLILLDTPPGTTHEMWAEGMARLGEADPMRLKSLMTESLYPVRRQQAAEALGQDHPKMVRLSKAEGAGAAREAELAEALEAYTDPTQPESGPVFDRKIRTLRPDWFEDDMRA